MALKGMAFVGNIYYVDDSEMDLDVSYVGFHTSSVESSVVVRVGSGQSALAMASAIVAAVKDRLENTHGMTVGILDTVRVVGLPLLDA